MQAPTGRIAERYAFQQYAFTLYEAQQHRTQPAFHSFPFIGRNCSFLFAAGKYGSFQSTGIGIPHFAGIVYHLSLIHISCSDNEQETGDNPAPTTGTMTFGVYLTGFTTRVTQDGTSWTNGDKIGTFALDADTFEPVLDNVNVPYVCAEDGQSVAFTSETPLAVQDDGKPVKFVAYYPYNADMQDFNYPVSIEMCIRDRYHSNLFMAQETTVPQLFVDDIPYGTTYYIRVRSNAADEANNSQWSYTTASTEKRPEFTRLLEDVSKTEITETTAIIRWKKDYTKDPVDSISVMPMMDATLPGVSRYLTIDEMLQGYAEIEGLTKNTLYTVNVYAVSYTHLPSEEFQSD